jgi:thiamine phosphate synthase YjbQ (UPF0047 family)
MATAPTELTLELSPESRVDVIDISRRVEQHSGDALTAYPKAVYTSYHTTAGFFEQSLCARLNNDPDTVRKFVKGFRHLFPPNADYKHDQLHLRAELSVAQRACEPRNADSHLTYIGSGLAICVTYVNKPDTPVFFIELDGINGTERRHRKTPVIGFNDSNVMDTVELSVPMSNHSIDSVNLRDPRLGLIEQFQELLDHYDITKGRIDISLHPNEHHLGLTVNEFETLLMQHDLVEVLNNPLRFMAEKGKNMLRDPMSIHRKAKNYAKYDLVHVVNEFIDALRLNESLVERIIDKFLAVPARRFLRMKRSVSLLVSDEQNTGRGSIVTGTYQSPILVQWKRAAAQTRRIEATFVRFD